MMSLSRGRGKRVQRQSGFTITIDEIRAELMAPVLAHRKFRKNDARGTPVVALPDVAGGSEADECS